MNLSLIFKLSLFGLAMAICTVYFIPSNVEPFCWLVIFIVCALIIARQCSSAFFLHGFLVSLVNSVWITFFHVLLFRKYATNHPDELDMLSKMQYGNHPRYLMAFTGPLIGIVSGLILGLLAYFASKIIRKPAANA